jgi:non-specific serine/threonine protein kinase/serine/threonine-protein kinase
MIRNNPFRGLDSIQLQRLDALLDSALDLPANARALWLEQIATAEPLLLEPLRRLLEAAAAPSVLDHELYEREDDVPVGPPLQLLRGDRLGAWQIDELAAHGGMSSVYRAHRADGAYQQQVALKLLDSLDPLRVAGLRRERELLARLEHPHIARLIDGGLSASGVPWLVLTWVEGENLDVWLQRTLPPLELRLQLFDQIASAVQYAHAHMVLHRDLKPANVRVTATGQAVLLDFGIARDNAPANGSAAPRTQVQLTPAYAAPEQLNGGSASVHTDVHGLGLLLFELLTGRHAFPQARDSLSAAVQAICQQDAPLPSVSLPASGPIRAAQLRGDLDAIVGKALQKPIEQRYANVAELRGDLAAYRAHRPVLARRGAWRYRSARWLQRHWLPAGLAALALLSLLGGSVIALREAAQARTERDLAQLEARRQDALREHLMLVFREGAGQGSGATSKQLLDASAVQLDDLYRSDPVLRRSVLLAMSELYFVLGDYTAARAMTERFLAQADAQTPLADRVTGELQLAQTLLRLGERDPAADLIAAAEQRLHPDPAHPRELQAQLLATQAALARADGELARSIQLQRAAVELSQRAVDSTPQKLGVAQSNLGVALLQSGDYPGARIELERALLTWEAGGLASSSNAVTTLGQLGNIQVLLGDLRAARQTYEAALRKASAQAPSAAQAALIHNHARVILSLGELAAAVDPLQRALEMAADRSGASGPDYASMLLTQAELQAEQGQLRDARATAERGFELLQERLGPAHPLVTRAELLRAWLAARSAEPNALLRLRSAADRLLASQPLLQRQGLRGLYWLSQQQVQRGDYVAARQSIADALAAPVFATASTWEQAELKWWQAKIMAHPAAPDATQVQAFRRLLSAQLGAEHPRIHALQH